MKQLTTFVLVLAGVVVVLYLLNTYSSRGHALLNEGAVSLTDSGDNSSDVGGDAGVPSPALNQDNEGPAPVDSDTNIRTQQQQADEANNASCFPKQQLTPSELLPSDASNDWSNAYPTGSGSLEGKNFLQSGHHVGINTVGQTLRNANMQLRSDPPNPQAKVSPWMQSTIEPDVNRRPLEIGGCA